MNENELRPDDAIRYIAAGHGRATLVGKVNRYTFRFGVAKDDKAHERIFVSLLTGSDNESDYNYIGFINGMRMQAGRKGNAAHPAFNALDWYLNAVTRQSDKLSQVHFYHEGVCGRCGRTLTVPESIERGIGPECDRKMEG